MNSHPATLHPTHFRVLHFENLLFLYGAGILIFLFSLILVALIGFLANMPISALTFVWASFPTVLAMVVLSQQLFFRKWLLLALLAVFMVGGSVLAAVRVESGFFDISYDGQAYHQGAILELMRGWNPIKSDVSQAEVAGLTKWIDHYTKGSWYYSAGISSYFNSIEAGKSANLLLILASFALSLFTLLHFKRLHRIYALLISGMLAFNPVSIYQSLSYYLDGQLSSALVCLFSLLVLTFFSRKWYVYFLVFVVTSILLNLKITAVAYAGVFYLGVFLFLFRHEKLDQIEKLFVTGAVACVLGLLIFGFNPYLTNLQDHGNPFYPAMGSDSNDYKTPNLPENYWNKPTLEILFLSAFAKADVKRGPGQFSQPKNPFQILPGEVQQFGYTDTNEGGWGPVFGLALIASLISMSAILIKVRHSGYLKVGAAVSFLLIVSCVVNPAASLARFTPQFWLVPVVVATVCLLHKKIWIKVAGLLILAILVFNNVMIAREYITNNQRVTADWEKILVQLADNPDQPLRVNFGEFRQSGKVRFASYNISFQEVKEAAQCSGESLFSNSIIVRCKSI